MKHQAAIIEELKKGTPLAVMEIADRRGLPQGHLWGPMTRLLKMGVVEPCVPGRSVKGHMCRAFRLTGKVVPDTMKAARSVVEHEPGLTSAACKEANNG